MSQENKNLPPGSARDWLKHATGDLNFALLGQKSADIFPEQVCFHAQQAAEKAIKSVLRYMEIDFPLTHDILQLLEIAENKEIEIKETIRDAVMLTPFAVQGRYPGFWGEISSDEVSQAIHFASVVVKWADELIS